MAEITGWDRFWSCYPRRIGKGAALKSWNKIDPDSEMEQRIMLAVDAQKRSRKRLEEANMRLPEKLRKFIPDWPHPSTWLNQQRWEDEIPSVSERATVNEVEIQCSKCPRHGYKSRDCWVTVGGKIYCNRCWTETFEDSGVKETALSVLREAYKNRIPEQLGEHLFRYLKRALKSGKERMQDAKRKRKEIEIEALAEREAIQKENA